MNESEINSLRVLEQEEAKEITSDSRVAGIRWDLVSWGLVLDLDIPTSEANDSPMHRGWLVFFNIAEITWPFANSRLPNGCWLTSDISVHKGHGGDFVFEFFVILPSFDKDEKIIGSPTEKVSLVAKQLIGVVSVNSARRTEGILSWQDRSSLASDDLFVRKVKGITRTPTPKRE